MTTQKIKELRTLRHRVASLENNLVCLGIECKELRTIDERLLSTIASKSASTTFELGDFDE